MKMRCASLLLPAGLMLLLAGHVGSAGGDKEKDKEKAAKSQPSPVPAYLVEVRFTNGSVVVMNLLQDKIDIVTEYGELTVPPRDIRSYNKWSQYCGIDACHLGTRVYERPCGNPLGNGVSS